MTLIAVRTLHSYHWSSSPLPSPSLIFFCSGIYQVSMHLGEWQWWEKVCATKDHPLKVRIIRLDNIIKPSTENKQCNEQKNCGPWKGTLANRRIPLSQCFISENDIANQNINYAWGQNMYTVIQMGFQFLQRSFGSLLRKLQEDVADQNKTLNQKGRQYRIWELGTQDTKGAEWILRLTMKWGIRRIACRVEP